MRSFDDGQFRSWLAREFAPSLGVLTGLLLSGQAYATPSFTSQTGAPCSSCHVGGFGPQLTEFGRDFKMNGYVLGANKAPNDPLSVMAVASFVRTMADQDAPPAPHTKSNDNVAFDQASVFLAGGINKNIGGFVQATYDGVERRFLWDNVDLRATNHIRLGGKDALVGLSLNNAPGVADPWNTLSAWGFPYTDSALAPSPAAAPLNAGGLAQTVVGPSAYIWWDRRLYVEAAVYASPGTSFLQAMGMKSDEASGLKGAAPYARIAYQLRPGKDKVLEIGAFGMLTDLYPGQDKSAGTTDRYSDLGVDSTLQWALPAGATLSLNGRYTHEDLKSRASLLLGDAENGRSALDDFRTDLSYYTAQGLGLTIGAFSTTGSKDHLRYADSASGSPNSSGLQLQLDYTLWPDGKSPFGGRTNVRTGLQYTHYNTFDGAAHDYDGSGRNASDNDGLRLFVWFAN